ncbi:BTAD domain-containing putative transcriptional regulator [Streptomyces sp. Li-HN-5-11]|uniref:AfsR/SARP family transcriptional regulator n=1 Tax=Streptomyces sp. Li-HN-5-11 TaxID=3075432 RepID=UPI0028B1E733|nr:BTAD domain-containing putative transcriptional regulator [Streptomyces sp. Li-HN-5-11]WNM31371.1 BTAD domain-containing putative transcriptional regulator [Streptomyces sp. Li-HN-5-11]
MEFRVLGPIEILDRGCNVVPTAPKPRQVISLLLLRRNTLVQTAELIDELWEQNPPGSAMTTLQTYVYKLRKVLLRQGGEEILHTKPGGYLLSVPDSAIDLHTFETDANAGKALLEEGDPVGAAAVLKRALSVWRGPALADVAPGSLLTSYVIRLQELHFRTRELRIQAELRLGLHRELISELKSLIMAHPLHENLHAFLMIALHRSGRRHEALEVYQLLRNNMVEELGLEPGQEVKQLHRALLADGPLDTSTAVMAEPAELTVLSAAPDVAPSGANAARPASLPAVAGVPTPAQLPADLADFTGREALVSDLVADFTADQQAGALRTAPWMALISGMPGVGKTALAVHLAHLIRDRFGGGQLFADLRASSTTPRDPAEVLMSFLRSLGMAEQQIPDGTEERCNLFRSVTANRRLLLVIDDVSSLADLRPLLPANPQCAVVVTGCRTLHGVGGAVNVDLDVMDHAEGVELLARIVGRARLEAERCATDRLVELCGRLPVALRCIGSRLVAVPGLPLTVLADRLTNSRQALDELYLGDLNLRAMYDSSYARLNRQEQSTFRLLSMLPGEAFTGDAVAELLGWEPAAVERVLTRFTDDHLIKVVGFDNDRIHYAFPELTRAYAKSRLESVLTDAAQSVLVANCPGEVADV